MSLAHQMYKAGNFKQALEHSNAVYERNPQRTDNLLLLGAIHYQVVRKNFNLTLNSLRLYLVLFAPIRWLLLYNFLCTWAPYALSLSLSSLFFLSRLLI
jgi:hypothetical protein